MIVVATVFSVFVGCFLLLYYCCRKRTFGLECDKTSLISNEVVSCNNANSHNNVPVTCYLNGENLRSNLQDRKISLMTSASKIPTVYEEVHQDFNHHHINPYIAHRAIPELVLDRLTNRECKSSIISFLDTYSKWNDKVKMFVGQTKPGEGDIAMQVKSILEGLSLDYIYSTKGKYFIVDV